MKYLLHKIYSYYSNKGLKATISKCYDTLKKKDKVYGDWEGIQQNKRYQQWRLSNQVTEQALMQQQNEDFEQMPLISIVVPVYNTKPEYLVELVNSIKKQSYQNWELCLIDGKSNKEETLRLLDSYAEEEQIVVKHLVENYGISGNTNEGIKIATGEFIAFSDHDDFWEPDALYEVVKGINQSNADMIYTDEDKVNEDSTLFYEPHFKPDFAIDNLRSCNYICHLTVVSKKVLDKVGLLDSRFDGSQDHELVLRIVEVANCVKHIPKILYHWRQFSTSMSHQYLEVCQEHGRLAVHEHLERIGMNGEIEQEHGYKINYEITRKPLISIIVINQDNTQELIERLRGIKSYTDYSNLEFVIATPNEECVDNKDGFIIVHIEESFNDFKARNLASQKSSGEFLLFLDEYLVPFETKWVDELLMFAQRSDVGVVGGKIFSSDENIIYSCEYAYSNKRRGFIRNFKGLSRNVIGYSGWERMSRNVSALPIELFMTKKTDFIEVGGFNELYEVSCADIEYSLALINEGKLNVFTPFAQMKLIREHLNPLIINKDFQRFNTIHQENYVERYSRDYVNDI